MDPRIPIAVALGVAYSIWVAAGAIKDTKVDVDLLRKYSYYALLAGIAFLLFVLVLRADDMPVSEILTGKNQSYRTIGGVSLGYSLIAASGIFWLASLASRDRA